MGRSLTYIIPAYNCESCIVTCLDSIFALPIGDGLEVIVVDDCSTDSTLAVLKEYASHHSNMVVLEQPYNQRQGAARNRGIRAASGEYIAFCDADDTIVVEGVMNALKAVSDTEADICYFDFEYEQPRGCWKTFTMPSQTVDTLMLSEEYLEHYYTCWYNAPWRNLYRRVFLQSANLRFEEGIRWEDCDWTVKVYAQARQIQFVGGIGYRYAQNANSTCCQPPTPQAMAEQLLAGLRLLLFADEIRQRLPNLSKTLSEEAQSRYVGVLRFHNLSKYSMLSVARIYSFLGSESRKRLAEYHFNQWIDFVLNHKVLVLSAWLLVHPATNLMRLFVSKVKN